MPADYVNRFGRKGSRGVRPWLLLPKVICVCLYVGGLSAALVVWVGSGFTSMDKADPRRLIIVNVLGALFVRLIVPAVIGALAFGAALLMQHPRVFLRMRWVQVKLIAVAILIVGAHLFLRSRLVMLREAAEARIWNSAAERQFVVGLIVAIAASIAIVILARLKPRLGQNWARTYRAIRR